MVACSVGSRGLIHLDIASCRSSDFFLTLHPTIFHSRGMFSCPWIRTSAKRTTTVSGTGHILSITSSAYVHSSYVPIGTHSFSSLSRRSCVPHSVFPTYLPAADILLSHILQLYISFISSPKVSSFNVTHFLQNMFFLQGAYALNCYPVMIGFMFYPGNITGL